MTNIRKTLVPEEWAVSGGLRAGWTAVMGVRLARARARLRAAAGVLGLAPAAAPRAGWRRAAAFVAGARGPAAERLLGEPALDYWLHLRETHFTAARPEKEWRLHYGLLGGLSAALALATKARAVFPAALPPGGRLNLHGSPFALAARPEDEFAAVELACAGGALEVRGLGAAARWSAAELAALKAGAPSRRGRWSLERLVEVRPGLVVDARAWLVNHGVVMHGIADLDHAAQERFAAVLRRAFDGMAAMDPALRDEMEDMVRVLVPLKTHETMSSVSSSYVSMRGVIALSHADSELLQAETLIHEFCHQKMNQLLEVDAVLEPGQGGQVFYSPWRKDARRLRGLLLGAHAFLNVARHIQRAVSRDSARKRASVDAMLGVATRALQVEEGLRAVDAYADLTPFGAAFMGVMRRELSLLRHGCLLYPRPLLREALKNAAAHRARHALGDTGLHRPEGFTDRVKRAPFLTPGGDERGRAA